MRVQNAVIQRAIEGERNWLSGRCKVAGGLRADEEVRLGVGDIADAHEKLPQRGIHRAGHSCLDAR